MHNVETDKNPWEGNAAESSLRPCWLDWVSVGLGAELDSQQNTSLARLEDQLKPVLVENVMIQVVCLIAFKI